MPNLQLYIKRIQKIKYLKLIWKDNKKKTIFSGEGFLCDEILMGYYINGEDV